MERIAIAFSAGVDSTFLAKVAHDVLGDNMVAYTVQAGMVPEREIAFSREVQIAPLAYMRGRTLDNAFVILDEAQNTTLSQIKMFLTRMGRNAKFVVTGDITQIDLPRRSDSGLQRAMSTLADISGIGIVEFDKRDIVRHQLVKYIVEAFDKREELENGLRTDRGDRSDR